MRSILSLWAGYTFFLSLPALLEFVRALAASLEVLRGWLCCGWLLLSLLIAPTILIIRRELRETTEGQPERS
jgi:hypothetical protein